MCVLFVCFTVLSVPCSLVVTCWERAVLLDLLYVTFSCVLSLFHIVFSIRCGTWFKHILFVSFVHRTT